MKTLSIALIALSLPAAALAQSAIDVQQISQPDFRGTARFMSMGGAFTALGGDLSAVSQNPAGIGIYRSSEVGATLDINFQNSKTSPSYSPNFPSQNSQTKAYCNNFGYVGSTRLDGALRTFNWGVNFNRMASFNRAYRGYVPYAQTSLSNYVAAYTTAAGYNYNDLDFNNSSYNPYFDSDADWLSILSYTSYMISPVSSNSYVGLANNYSTGDAMFNVIETGYLDEYDITFGGNVENLVYWGATIGINDLNYTRTIYYSESLADATIYDFAHGGTTTGDAGFELASRKYIRGTGWNLKFGLIVKPINEFRIGFAVHTPSWYHLEQGYDGSTTYSYYNYNMPQSTTNPFAGSDYSEDAYFNWHYRSPWKLMLGAAAVIEGKLIISADYQYDGYGNQSISTPVYYNGFASSFEQNEVVNSDIKSYFKAANTARFGLEYRVTPQFSVRAGYNYRASCVKDAAANGEIEVYTSGTDASYAFDQDIWNLSFGLGYRYQAWYIDAAYVYKNRKSTFHAFTDFDGFMAPRSEVIDHNSSIVLSTGFKF